MLEKKQWLKSVLYLLNSIFLSLPRSDFDLWRAAYIERESVLLTLHGQKKCRRENPARKKVSELVSHRGPISARGQLYFMWSWGKKRWTDLPNFSVRTYHTNASPITTGEDFSARSEIFSHFCFSYNSLSLDLNKRVWMTGSAVWSERILMDGRLNRVFGRFHQLLDRGGRRSFSPRPQF